MTKTDGWLVKVGYEHYFMSEMDAKMLMGISKRSVHVSYDYISEKGGYVSTAKKLQEQIIKEMCHCSLEFDDKTVADVEAAEAAEPAAD